MATAGAPTPSLSLLGGPFHQLGIGLGLVPGTRTIAFGLAIGMFFWMVSLVLVLLLKCPISDLTQKLFTGLLGI